MLSQSILDLELCETGVGIASRDVPALSKNGAIWAGPKLQRLAVFAANEVGGDLFSQPCVKGEDSAALEVD